MAKTQAWKIEVRGAKSLHKALQILQETDAPFLREALETSGNLLRSEAAQRAPAGIAQTVAFVGVKGKGAQLRALIRVKHPGGKSMEFGRQYYYRGYRGRQMKMTGQRFKAAKGQKAKPYLGIIKGDAAIAAARDKVETLILDAFEKEWIRIAGEGD